MDYKITHVVHTVPHECRLVQKANGQPTVMNELSFGFSDTLKASHARLLTCTTVLIYSIEK